MRICLLGASGSIGKQTLDVMKKNREDFSLSSFAVGNRTRCISNIIKHFPEVTHVYMIDSQKAKYYAKRYPHISFYSGGGMNKLITESDNEMVVNALVGFSGLSPSICALENNKLLALANKESLVVGGEIINALLRKGKGKLYPIDSEHSAIWKCLKVSDQNVDKICLTASGGAFRKLKIDELKDVKASDALKHPTWKMGNKITIDCATMMNKAFELIEAYYLFGYKSKDLKVTLHDESYLHSYVSYKDGLFRGELSKPDMRNPIKFALYQGSIPFKTQTFTSLDSLKGLHFHEFNPDRYPLVSLADLVISKGGTYGAIINASNEVAVNAFLKDEIAFLDIDKIIRKSIKEMPYIAHPTLEEIFDIDKQTRAFATKLVKGGIK